MHLDFVRFLTVKEELPAGMTMKEAEELLPETFFLRIHRSYIVSINAITEIFGNIIEIGTSHIPIGANYKETVMATIRQEEIGHGCALTIHSPTHHLHSPITLLKMDEHGCNIAVKLLHERSSSRLITLPRSDCRRWYHRLVGSAFSAETGCYAPTHRET